MSARELMDVNNKNTLSALAYIRENENPYHIFCNFVLYCLEKAPSHVCIYEDLHKGIHENFGLNMSSYMITNCCRYLKSKKEIEILKYGQGYKLISTSFDVEKFEQDQKLLKISEHSLLDGLITYVKQYNQEWDRDQARRYLAELLIDQEKAHDIFAFGKIEIATTHKHIPPTWYVGKFVQSILDNNVHELREYLIDVTRGAMVYIGAYDIDNYTNETQQKFRKTDFYLDTKLVLRLLGYSWQLEIESSKDFVKLIRDEYYGSIRIFEHTITEVEKALGNAASSLRHNRLIRDAELNHYAKVFKCSADDFDIYAQSVRDRLTNELKFESENPLNWNDQKTQKHNINTDEIKDYILGKYPNWNTAALNNDLDVLNYINIMREGNYSVAYGGNKHLPIFVTTNYTLVKSIKEYASEVETSTWGHYIPIISDRFLMYKLWLPKAHKHSMMPILTLSRFAMAAQQATPDFYEKLKNCLTEITKKHKTSFIDLNAEQQKRFEAIIVKNINGDPDNMNDEVVAYSAQELIQMETMADKAEISSLQETVTTQETIMNSQQDEIVEAISRRFINKIGLWKILILLAEQWLILTAAVLAILTIIVGIIQETYLRNSLIGAGFVVLALIIYQFLDKFLPQDIVRLRILNRIVAPAWNHYKLKILKNLTESEQKYGQSVLYFCKCETRLFQKYEDFCPD